MIVKLNIASIEVQIHSQDEHCTDVLRTMCDAMVGASFTQVSVFNSILELADEIEEITNAK